MKKRTYGTGSVHEIRKGTWELRYAPRNSKRLYKYVHVATRKDAEDELTAWRKQLDRQKNPGVKVPCSELLALHFADMRRRQRDGKNILDQEKKAEKHLVPFFGSREASSITVEDLNEYVDYGSKKAPSPQPSTGSFRTCVVLSRADSNSRRS
jgi:hypothetical protein